MAYDLDEQEQLANLKAWWAEYGNLTTWVVIAGLAAQGDWQTVQQFLNSTPFGVTDPEFGIDVSFYAFQLPFYRYVLDWLFVAVAISFVVSLVTHYVFGGIRLTGRAGVWRNRPSPGMGG